MYTADRLIKVVKSFLKIKLIKTSWITLHITRSR